MKHLLSIAGSDCSGGAGIQADLKTFSALGTFGMSVIASVVAENTARVLSVYDLPPQAVSDQIDAVFEDIRVDAVKIGMLSNLEIMRAVARKLRQYAPAHVVLDPVMVATSGGVLMQPDALEYLRGELLPLAELVTPNLPEAEALTGISIRTEGQMREAAVRIHTFMAQEHPAEKYVLVKGGHLQQDALDVLYDGSSFQTFTAERVPSTTPHGTGCTLSSAAAAFLAKGLPVADAVKEAKSYVTEAIQHGLDIGKGHGPTNHFYQLFQED